MFYNAPLNAEGEPARLTECRLTRTADMDKRCRRSERIERTEGGAIRRGHRGEPVPWGRATKATHFGDRGACVRCGPETKAPNCALKDSPVSAGRM